MTTERQAVKVLADTLAKTFKAVVDDNNKYYVNNQIKNFAGGSGGSASIFTGSIDPSQVRGLYEYITNNLTNSFLDNDPNIQRIIASIHGISALEVRNFVADTARINELYANYGEFIHLVAQSIEAGSAEFGELATDVAYITSGYFGSASIDSAMIKVSATDTAFIREGVGNKYYIDNLAVTEGNIVNLSVGNLMIADPNGNLVRIAVDEHGQVVVDPNTDKIVTGIVMFEGDDIISEGALVTKGTVAPIEPNNGDIWCDTNSDPAAVKVWNGTLSAWAIDSSIDPDDLVDGEYYGTITGNRIRNASINATELNVESIFASEARVMDLIAANINAVKLFANQGIIPQLKSSVISSLSDSDFNNSLGSGISKITLAHNLIDLVVKTSPTQGDPSYTDPDDPSHTELILTDEMMTAISDKFSVIANTINLSGNTSVKISSSSQIQTDVFESLAGASSRINQLANMIGFIVEGDGQSSEFAITHDAMVAISSNIVLSGDTIAEIASQIDLAANNSVKVYVGNAVSDIVDSEFANRGPQIIQTVVNSSEYQTLSTQVTENAESLSIAVNSSIPSMEGQLQTMSRWFKFTSDGFNVGKSGSTYTTLTDDTGFHVLQLNEKIGSFAKRQLKAEEVRVGVLNSTGNRCVLREAQDGGLIIAVEGTV